MPAYGVLEAQGPREWSNDKGTFHSWTLQLQGVEKPVEINQLPTTPPPAPGASLDLTLEAHPKFADKLRGRREAQQRSYNGSSGPSKDYKADPAKQAAIAMESAHKVAVQILDIAIRDGHYKPPEDRPVGEMTSVVRTIAASLYQQILEASEAAAR